MKKKQFGSVQFIFDLFRNNTGLNNLKWDRRFLGLAEHISEWSRDPSTKVGAVIVRPDKTIVSLGFNGFPRGVDDLADRYNHRETKYQFICHAEENALLTAGENLSGCTIYTHPFHPCNECAKLIIQSGIKRVVTKPTKEGSKWEKSFAVAKTMFDEAEITVDFIK